MLRRIRRLFQKSRAETELDQELRFHLNRNRRVCRRRH